MGTQKCYSGYKSYQYLEKGRDYKDFKLAKEIERVEPYLVPLSKSEEKRAEDLLRECIVISLHDHPVIFPEDMSELFEYIRQGREFMGYEGLSVSGLDAVFDALWDGFCFITSKMGWKWSDVIYDLGMKLCDIAHQNFVIRAEGVADIIEAHNEGKVALIPYLEASTMIENEVDRIDILYGLGVRMMGIVYSESNALGSGLKEDKDGGLTYFGREAVKRMNKLGMAIDISHTGDRTALDVIEESKKPVFLNHTGARALWNIKFLKPDKVLRACAEKGGIIGIMGCPKTTATKKHPEQSIESYMEHFEYCVELVGIDHVGFGPDIFFGDHVALQRILTKFLALEQGKTEEKEKVEVEYVKGLENPSEAFLNIVRWLVKHGYTDQEIEKVLGGNALRTLKEVWNFFPLDKHKK